MVWVSNVKLLASTSYSACLSAEADRYWKDYLHIHTHRDPQTRHSDLTDILNRQSITYMISNLVFSATLHIFTQHGPAPCKSSLIFYKTRWNLEHRCVLNGDSVVNGFYGIRMSSKFIDLKWFCYCTFEFWELLMSVAMRCCTWSTTLSERERESPLRKPWFTSKPNRINRFASFSIKDRCHTINFCIQSSKHSDFTI